MPVRGSASVEKSEFVNVATAPSSIRVKALVAR